MYLEVKTQPKAYTLYIVILFKKFRVISWNFLLILFSYRYFMKYPVRNNLFPNKKSFHKIRPLKQIGFNGFSLLDGFRLRKAASLFPAVFCLGQFIDDERQ